jgi:hypothetical protein
MYFQFTYETCFEGKAWVGDTGKSTLNEGITTNPKQH